MDLRQWNDGSPENRKAWVKEWMGFENIEERLNSSIEALEKIEAKEWKEQQLKMYQEIIRLIQEIKNDRNSLAHSIL